MKIGFFDSGLGGLTVLHEALKVFPNEEYIYYADTDNVPYGTKTKEDVKQYILNAVEFMAQKNIDALVVACNTGTSVAIEDLRKKYNIPIIGMEPAVKPAILEGMVVHKRVLVTATALTLKQEKLKNLISMLDNEGIVDLLPLSGLVEFAEKYIFDKNIVSNYLTEELKPYNLNDYSTLVLGCTHFTLFRDILKSIVPEHIAIIDGNEGTVRNLKNIIVRNNMKSSKNFNITYYRSGTIVIDKEQLDRYNQIFSRLANMK